MNQLKPKTRPTAPPSLKKNVMDRIQRELLYGKVVHKPQASLLNRLRFNRGRMLSAAALLLLIVGITCTFWPTDRTLSSENGTGQVLNTIIQTVSPSLTMSSRQKLKASSIISTFPNIKKHSMKAGTSTGRHKHRKTILHHEYNVPVIIADASQNDTEPVEETVSHTDNPSLSSTLFTPEEQKLIEQIRQKSDLVRACLAEELYQARLAQYKIAEIRTQYENELLKLQNNIWHLTPQESNNEHKKTIEL